MNPPLTTEDLISFINLCFSLTENEKDDLKRRVLDELETRGNRLSSELAEEIAQIFEREGDYLKSDYLPDRDKKEQEMLNEYREELERIRPALNDLVETYRNETQELTQEYNKAFRELDAQFDHVMQKEKGREEAAEIEAIRAKLASKKS